MTTVWRYIRSAPLTYSWLVVLLATTIIQHSMSVRRVRALLQKDSTNLHHLASDPIRVLIESLLWIDGKYWWPYLLVFTAFLAPAERWLGQLRWLIAGLVCHVGATYLSEGYLYWTIQEAIVSPRLIDARDIGVSYFVAGIVAVLTYRVPLPWRWVYVAATVLVFVVALAMRTNFTGVGHLCAVGLGLACYPLTRSRRVAVAAA
ncbi:rhomboid-like protein [Mycobacterium sp. MMS18-G62]